MKFGDRIRELRRLAGTFDADGEEPLVPAKRVAEKTEQRVLERRDTCHQFARLDDAAIDRILKLISPKLSKR